jgi:hypothetical protein
MENNKYDLNKILPPGEYDVNYEKLFKVRIILNSNTLIKDLQNLYPKFQINKIMQMR